MRQLVWKHRGWFARRWDLLEGDRPIATLEQRGWGFGAELRIGERRYPLSIVGFWRWRIELRDENGSLLATMPLGWRGQGRPTLADGRAFEWDAENWWGTRWALTQKGAGPVARVHMDSFLRLDARIEVEDAQPLREDELIGLLALTWLAVVVTMQAASSAGAG